MAQGERLTHGSGEPQATQLQEKLKTLDARWQRMEDTLNAREAKLQETLNTVQQLEANLSKLRRWLARMEHKLAVPIKYQNPDLPEIQSKLEGQKELQKDIEKHSAGVGSVLNLCEVLLRDPDACPTETEKRAIEQAMGSLDKRWSNICQQVSNRKQSIDATWDLWQQFHDGHLLLDDWLKDIEKQCKDPNTQHVTVQQARVELKKFEVRTSDTLIHFHQSALLTVTKQRISNFIECQGFLFCL